MCGQLLTRKQAASLLNISLPTLDKYTREGTIPAVRLGGIIRFRRDVIDNLYQPFDSQPKPANNGK